MRCRPAVVFLWYRPPPSSPRHVPPGRFELQTEAPLRVFWAPTEGIMYSLAFSLSLSSLSSLSLSLSSLSLTAHSLTVSPYLSHASFSMFIPYRFIHRPQTGFTSVYILVSYIIIIIFFVHKQASSFKFLLAAQCFCSTILGQNQGCGWNIFLRGVLSRLIFLNIVFQF